jgi:hypothetical protein
MRKPNAKPLPTAPQAVAAFTRKEPLTSLARDIQAVAIAAADLDYEASRRYPPDQLLDAPVLLRGERIEQPTGTGADNPGEPVTFTEPCNCPQFLALQAKLEAMTANRDDRERARAEADKIACKVFAEASELRAELEKLGYIFRASDTLKRERDDLRAELVTLKKAMAARLQSEHDREWVETYRSALSGGAGNFSAAFADGAHGKRAVKL